MECTLHLECTWSGVGVCFYWLVIWLSPWSGILVYTYDIRSVVGVYTPVGVATEWLWSVHSKLECTLSQGKGNIGICRMVNDLTELEPISLYCIYIYSLGYDKLRYWGISSRQYLTVIVAMIYWKFIYVMVTIMYLPWIVKWNTSFAHQYIEPETKRSPFCRCFFFSNHIFLFKFIQNGFMLALVKIVAWW